MPDYSVANNPDRDRFEVTVDGHTAVLEYRLAGNAIALTHTATPPPVRNRGVGSALVRTALDYAETHGLRVEPRCAFVAAFIGEHDEYEHLVD